MGLIDYFRKPTSNPRPWQSLVMPEAVTRVRSMLTLEEKQYLSWLTAEKFEGWGAVVDLGPWLGSSSVALAEGLSRRGSSAKVHSFDLFQWEPGYMAPVADTGLRAGDDFLPTFLRETAAYAAWIDARKQDLSNYRWDGGPIEILFVDAAKSWELTNAIFRGFAAHLQPGRSRIVLQDFRYFETHWLTLIFDSRPDLWKEIEDVEDGHTVTFTPVKPLTGPAGIQTDYSEEAFPLESAERFLRSRIAGQAAGNQHCFLRMLYRKYLLDGTPEEALKLREELLSDGTITSAEMARIEDLEYVLVPRGWQAYGAGEYGRAADIARQSLAVSRKISVYPLVLLGFSLFRTGDQEGACKAIQEVLSIDPQNPSAMLFVAETAILEGRYTDAERGALDVIGKYGVDPVTINFALDVLSQAMMPENGMERLFQTLVTLEKSFPKSPALLSRLAVEQRRAGLVVEALRSVERALALAPPPELMAELREEWNALSPTEPETSAADAAGRLHRPQSLQRSPVLADAALGELTGELLARATHNAFSESEEVILLGLELDRVLRAALNVHNNRFSKRRYFDLFGCFYAYVNPPSPPLAGATIIDLGCGSLNPFGFLFLCLMLGARRGIAIDLDGIHDWPRALDALADLAGEMLIDPGGTVGEFAIDREQILRNIASFDLAKLRAGDRTGIDPSRLTHRRESVHKLSLMDEEADVIFSNAFFEHIPSVEEAITELARVTRPGGVGIHVIDCSDHRRYHNPEVHPLEFLTEIHTETLPHGSNLLRPLEFAELFTRRGFEVVEMGSFQRAEVTQELRSRLAERFREMSDEDLAVTIVKLVVRRCSS